MKRLFTSLATCAVLTYSAVAASPAATENWVKDYVAKHAGTNSAAPSSSKAATVTASQIIDGTNVTFSMTILFASEPSWKIVESTVPGMAVGTHFAIDEYGNACNYTNTACQFIYQSFSTNWTFVTKGVTNVRSVVQLDFNVSGNDYRGWEDYRHKEATAAGVSNSVGYVVFRRSYVLPSVKRKLLTPPNQVSWISFLFPRAHAAWVLGEWELDPDVDPNPEEDGDYFVYHWASHYGWDGEAAQIEIPSVSGQFNNGAVRNFEVNVELSIPLEGGDYCDRENNIDTDKIIGDTLDALKDGAKASMGEESVAYKMFERMLVNSAFNDQISTAIRNATSPYTSANLTCPQKKTTREKKPEEEEDPKEPEKPDPLTPPSGVCTHKSVYCSSSESVCSFRCRVCKTVLAEGDHNYVDSPEICAKCDNTYRGVKCGRVSMNRDLHDFGPEYGGNEIGCFCKHGRIWAPHPKGSLSLVSGWLFDDVKHWRNYKCGVCGYQPIKKDMEDHASWMQEKGPYYYPNRCETSNICYRCGYAVLGKEVGHKDPGVHYHEFANDAIHSNYYNCTMCRGKIYCGSSPHIDGERYKDYTNDDDTSHMIRLQCSNTDGCGGFYLTGPFPHGNFVKTGAYETCSESNRYHFVMVKCGSSQTNGCGRICRGQLERCESFVGAPQIVLVDDVSKPDYYPCRWCRDGHGKEVAHNWSYNKNRHWCSNDETNPHLEGAHTLVGNVCIVCGYSVGQDDYEYKSVLIKIDCKDSCCSGGSYKYHRLCMTNGVEIAEKDRGPWISDGYSPETPSGCRCRFEDLGKCVCPYCRGDTGDLMFNDCYCKHIALNDLIKITDPDVSASYHLRFAGWASIVVDFSDPVYDIGDFCFQEAFVSMPKLEYVNISTTTNTGSFSFDHAFTNSTRLAQVNFKSLQMAGDRAFDHAFCGCCLKHGVRFDSLVNCGYGCFSGAFANTQIESLEFPNLVNPGGSLDFFSGTPCSSIRILSAPKLSFETDEVSNVFNFVDMPNLTSIDLSGVATNVINVIGDLSPLSKLTRIDFHEVSGIPSYVQTGSSQGVHAPTGNTNCMIVVANELWEDWCRAPGWSSLAAQIVPYSNQVIRSYVTVSFDSDGGDAIESTNIVSGTGIAPTAGIHKYPISYPLSYDDGAFALDGWYRDSSKTVRYSDGDPICANLTLHAKWNDNRSITTGPSQSIVKYPESQGGFCSFSVTIGQDSKIGLSHDSVASFIVRTLSYEKPKTASTVVTTNEVCLANVSWPTLNIDNNISDIVSETTGPWEGQVVSPGVYGDEVSSEWFSIDVTVYAE